MKVNFIEAQNGIVTQLEQSVAIISNGLQYMVKVGYQVRIQY